MSKWLYTGLALLRALLNVAITLFVGAWFDPALSSVFLLFRRDHTTWANALHLGLPYYQYFDAEEGGKAYRALQTLGISIVAGLLIFTGLTVFSPAAASSSHAMLVIASVVTSTSFSVNAYFAIHKQPLRLALFETGIQIGPYLAGTAALLLSGLHAALMCYAGILVLYLPCYLYAIGCFRPESLRLAVRSVRMDMLRNIWKYGFPRMVGGFSEVAVLTIGLHALPDAKTIAAWTILTALARAVPILFQPISFLHGTGNSAIANMRIFIGIVALGAVSVSAAFAYGIYSGYAALLFPKLDIALDHSTALLLMLSPGLIMLYSIKDMVDYKRAAPINACAFALAVPAGWVIYQLWPSIPLHIVYFAEINAMAAFNLWLITGRPLENTPAVNVDDQYI